MECNFDLKNTGVAECQPHITFDFNQVSDTQPLVMSVLRDGKGAPLIFYVQTADTLKPMVHGIVRMKSTGPVFQWSTGMNGKAELALNEMADRLIS